MGVLILHILPCFFQVHALENHPGSSILFGNAIKQEKIYDSLEYDEHYSDFGENYKTEDPIEYEYPSPIVPEVKIKEEFIEKVSDQGSISWVYRSVHITIHMIPMVLSSC